MDKNKDDKDGRRLFILLRSIRVKVTHAPPFVFAEQ